MKGSWIVAGATCVLLLGSPIWAQNTAEKPGKPTEMNKATDAVIPRADEAPVLSNADRLNQIVAAACTETWAAQDEETRRLVDKMLAARKVVIQTEMERAGALEELVLAARGGDEAAIKKAAQKVLMVGEKLRQDSETANNALRDLINRLRQLMPAPAKAPAKAGADSKGTDTAAPPAEKTNK